MDFSVFVGFLGEVTECCDKGVLGFGVGLWQVCFGYGDCVLDSLYKYEGGQDYFRRLVFVLFNILIRVRYVKEIYFGSF